MYFLHIFLNTKLLCKDNSQSFATICMYKYNIFIAKIKFQNKNQFYDLSSQCSENVTLGAHY